MCARFCIEFVPVVSAKAAATSREVEVEAEKTSFAHIHSQRPLPYPQTPLFLTPELKAKGAPGFDVPPGAPIDIKPDVAGKKCRCELPYDEKKMKPLIEEPAVLYQLGPATHKVRLWEVNCQMDRADCRQLGNGDDFHLCVCTERLVIADSMFYDTLDSVSIG